MAATDIQIKHMVEQFLRWKLPEDFNPDGGVRFEKTGNTGTTYEYTREPVGTNLLNYAQADAMVRHMLDGLPPEVMLVTVDGDVMRDQTGRIGSAVAST